MLKLYYSLKRSLDIRRQTLGRDHSDVAESLNNFWDFYTTHRRNLKVVYCGNVTAGMSRDDTLHSYFICGVF